MTTEKLCLIACMLLILALLNCWIEAERRNNWYEKQFHAAPRLQQCPFKRSTFSRLLFTLLSFPFK